MKNFCIRSDNVRQTFSFVFLPSFLSEKSEKFAFSVYFKLNFPLAQVNQSDCENFNILAADLHFKSDQASNFNFTNFLGSESESSDI